MEHKIHTVIFDLDGTLTDSAVITRAACERIAPAYGLPIPSYKEIRKAMGYQMPEFFYLLFPDFPKDKVAIAGEHIHAEGLRLVPDYKDRLLFEGCRETLFRLKENNVHLYIVSAGEPDRVPAVLEMTGIIDLFDKVLCGISDKAEMIREIVSDDNKAGYVMVGDMKKDREAARANGIVSVGACYGYCRKGEENFDCYIDSPMDLLGILKIEEKRNAAYNNV